MTEKEKAAPFYRGVRALLAEDNLVNQEVISTMLENRGIEVTAVANGVDAIQKLRELNFDIIFMDCQMPLQDGYETIRQIRADLRIKNLPVIAISARDQQEKCLQAGMNDYISKPVRAGALDEVLLKFLKSRHPVADSQSITGIQHISLDTASIDVQILEQLKEDTQKKFSSIIKTYMTEAENLLQMIDQSLKQDDRKSIEYAAHSLKSASGQIGAVAMRAQMDFIETHALGGNLNEIREVFSKAVHSYGRLKEQLLQIIA